MSKRLLSFYSFIFCGLLVGSLTAHAGVEISQRGKIVRLNVTAAPISEVMQELADTFDFAIEGAPEHWSTDDIDFKASGELEDVLSSLLKDTSHMYAYHTDVETRRTRIVSVKLLNLGQAGTAITQSPQRQRPARARTPRNTRTIGTGLIDSNGVEQTAVIEAADDGSRPPSSRAIGGRSSNLSSALERRARMTAMTDGSSANAPEAPRTTLTGDQQADMQALTQRALQDVQNLADALRQAEAPR